MKVIAIMAEISYKRDRCGGNENCAQIYIFEEKERPRQGLKSRKLAQT
jgi:hypothetical protein